MELIKNLIHPVQVVSLSQIVENPDNPRTISEDKYKKLVDSIADFPKMLYARQLICIPTMKDKWMVMGGNMRLKAIPEAIKLLNKRSSIDLENKNKWEHNLRILNQGIPITDVSSWTEEEIEEFVIKDNVSFGEHDWDMLANKFESVKLVSWGLDIPNMAYVPLKPEEDDYTEILPAKIPITQPGDVYELNGHRVYCGDCTDAAAMMIFMGKELANLTFTSPPYWVGKDYETQRSEAEIDEFIDKVAFTMQCCTKTDNSRIVINTGTASINRIDKKRKVEVLPLIDKWSNALKGGDWLLRHLRIWVKRGQLPASISPKTDVIDQHNEYIATFEKEWSQIMTYWNESGTEQRGQERIGTSWAQQGVWDDVHGQKSAQGLHNAAFPVEIPYRNILLYTKKGDIVLDVFGGSGTTLIACEQGTRIARLSEISPAYVDVIVQRWEKYMQEHTKNYTITRNGETFKSN